MAITFRAQKGQALSYAEMDTNLGSYIYSASTSNNGQQLDLHYTSSAAASMNQATIAVPLTKGIGTAGSNMRIPYFNLRVRSIRKYKSICYSNTRIR